VLTTRQDAAPCLSVRHLSRWIAGSEPCPERPRPRRPSPRSSPVPGARSCPPKQARGPSSPPPDRAQRSSPHPTPPRCPHVTHRRAHHHLHRRPAHALPTALMPSKARRRCTRCHTPVTSGEPCPTCAARTATRTPPRGTPTERGYDAKWRRIRAQYLKHHPVCCLCGAPSEVPDHWPLSRRQLLEAGDPHPDAWTHLRPLCRSCHSRETNRNQPGGWNKRSPND
jgi:5-methylcytosine-specific restriction protein A